MQICDLVSTFLKTPPMVSATLEGATTVRFERYYLGLQYSKIPAFPIMALIIHLGGARVTEGLTKEKTKEYIPGQSSVLPMNCATEWSYAGFVDFAIVYFLDNNQSQAKRLHNLVSKNPELQAFNSPLIYALGQRIADKLKHGSKADLTYIEQLKELMIEETCRLFEAKKFTTTQTDTQQIGRVKQAVQWMQDNITSDISFTELADKLLISEPHFRKIFNDAMGMPPNRYLLHLRLEHVRKLLTNSDWSITRIAMHYGFKTQSHLTACFKKSYGVTPAKMRTIASKNARK